MLKYDNKKKNETPISDIEAMSETILKTLKESPILMSVDEAIKVLRMTIRKVDARRRFARKHTAQNHVWHNKHNLMIETKFATTPVSLDEDPTEVAAEVVDTESKVNGDNND